MEMNPIVFLKRTYCPDCGTDTMEIYNMYNKPIGYPAMVRNFSTSQVLEFLNQEKYPLSYIKCTKCNRTYLINWTDGLPKPLFDTDIIHSKFRGKSK
jgi:hypothetical protein